MPQEGDLKDGTAGKVKKIWIVCPKCKKGRWVNTQILHNLGFSGLCTNCALTVANDAFSKYRNVENVIRLRNIVKAARKHT
jgi:hypothetical protein